MPRAKTQPNHVSANNVTVQYKVDSPELESYLGSVYNLTEKSALQRINERIENPALWPLSEVEKAEAFLAALHTAPIAVSTRIHERQTGRKI